MNASHQWLAKIDRSVEREAEHIRLVRSLKITACTLAMGFVLGCMFESWTGLAARFMEWLG
jgi:hypothetical protein